MSSQITTATLVNQLNMLEVDYLPTTVKQYKNEFDRMGFDALWAALGRSTPTADYTWSHFEMGRVWRNMNVNANVAAPGAGLPITWTLPASDHWLSGTVSYPRVGQTVLFDNGVRGIITAVNTGVANAHTVTVNPVNTTDTIPALTGGTSQVVILYNAYAEGSAAGPGSVMLPTTQYTYTSAILREEFSTTGTADTVRTWTMEDGTGAYSFIGNEQTIERHLNQIDMLCLMGVVPTSATASYAGINITPGLLPFAEAGGGYQTYTPTFWATSDMDDQLAYFDSIQAGKDYMGLFSFNLYKEIEDAYQNAFGAGAIRYADYDGASEITLALNIAALEQRGYTIKMKRFPLFSNPTQLGSNGQKYQNYGVLVPMGTAAVGYNGQRVPLYEHKYRKLGSRSRKYQVWTTDGFITSQADKRTENYLSDIGGDPKCAFMFGGFSV